MRGLLGNLLWVIAVLGLLAVAAGVAGVVGLAFHWAFQAWRGDPTFGGPACANCGRTLPRRRRGRARTTVRRLPPDPQWR